MIGKSPDRTQKDLFQPLLSEFINLRHELVLLSEKINCKELEDEFFPLYSTTGTPSIPLRTNKQQIITVPKIIAEFAKVKKRLLDKSPLLKNKYLYTVTSLFLT